MESPGNITQKAGLNFTSQWGLTGTLNLYNIFITYMFISYI